MADTTNWVIDTSVKPQDGMLCFCPYENGDVLVGLSLLAQKPPGKVIGCFHPSSPQALVDFKTDHAELLKQFGVNDG